MDTTLLSVLTIVATAVLSGVVTYLTTRRNLEMQYDANLRQLRIEAYQKLWRCMGTISKYDRQPKIDLAGVKQLNHALTRWYYDDGGMLLSDPTRREYFALQDALEMLARANCHPGDADDQFLVVLGSRLRSALTRDIGSRKTFMLASPNTPIHPRQRRTGYERDNGRASQIEIERRRRPTVKGLRRTLRSAGTVFVTTDYVIRADGRAVRRWRWRDERSGFTNDGDGRPCTRVRFLEGDRLVEGPTSWSRLSEPTPLSAATWTAHSDEDLDA